MPSRKAVVILDIRGDRPLGSPAKKLVAAPPPSRVSVETGARGITCAMIDIRPPRLYRDAFPIKRQKGKNIVYVCMVSCSHARGFLGPSTPTESQLRRAVRQAHRKGLCTGAAYYYKIDGLTDIPKVRERARCAAIAPAQAGTPRVGGAVEHVVGRKPP